MADSLVLTGVKDVKKHTGTEMLLTRPNRGGDQWSLKKWWGTNDGNVQYVTCTVFKVTQGANSVYLALDTSRSTNVRIDSDTGFTFAFYHPNELERAALYTDDWELIESYIMPAISGGKVAVSTSPGGASRPG